ncbi:DNA polymerase subunit Cdc27 [Mycena belliarum]|uniref:DNA polymerase delta subunit 3 n=1 Tax=Mycena belliarum TaxID=1033014 RepID=A0AAD6XN02_9AGAR|nr:DNA polymerase subunit Cdc27 [Mycena belliae]
MSTQPIRDYLTKQLMIDRNIVTFRSLSRALMLNVNVAKNELAEFFANEGQELAATYLLSGQIQPAPSHLDEDIDMDPYAEEKGNEDGEYAPVAEMILVTERELERVQAHFIELDCIHIYSLSPSPIRDAGLLCAPTEIVRDLDKKKGAEMAAAVGKVISAQVTVSTKPLPSWGGRKVPPPVAGSSKTVAPPVKKEDDTKAKEKEKAKAEKPKPTGKLDFSKAKTKPLKKEEEKPQAAKAEPKRKVASRPPSVASTVSEKVQVKMEESKRGTKRKSALVSDSEDEVVPTKGTKSATKSAPKPAPKAQSSVRVRKGVVISDDENDEPPAPVRKGKGKAKAVAYDSDNEDIRAMMEIDDGTGLSLFLYAADTPILADDVTRASRDAPPPAAEIEDVDMSDGESMPAPTKPKPKRKVVPIGRNGLKKRRVVRSKMRVDEKGYMVTDDYSEYESVEEGEEAPAPKAKTKPKAKDAAPAKSKDTAPAKAAPKPKPAPPPKAAPARSTKSAGSSKPQGQASVASFFGKSKSK